MKVVTLIPLSLAVTRYHSSYTHSSTLDQRERMQDKFHIVTYVGVEYKKYHTRKCAISKVRIAHLFSLIHFKISSCFFDNAQKPQPTYTITKVQ